MKAFLLAAGYGTRLKPITDSIPKCLVPIKGQPLMGWWLHLLQKHGVTDVLVNTHYLHEQVTEFAKSYNSKNGLKIYSTYESKLLGSGGTIRANYEFVKDEDNFLICYADNLTDANLSAFQKFHKNHNGILSMALFRTNIPKQCGIVELDSEDRIVTFSEKPEHPKSNLANAGLYIADSHIIEYLNSDEDFLDFGKDVLPKLIGRMYGWNINSYLIDIGTLENYKKANGEWDHDYNEDTLED